MEKKLGTQDRVFKWCSKTFKNLRTPEPYDASAGGTLFEIDAPDGSTEFLVYQDHFDEDSGLIRLYAIEAPAGCPMREAFEWGDFTWDEYWTHKDCLYEIITPFEPGPVSSRIIAPGEISKSAKDRFVRLGERFPYELKRRHLELGVEYSVYDEDKHDKAQREYDAFMAKYGHRFAKRAA